MEGTGAGPVDSGIARAYSFSRHVEGLRLLSLLPVLPLLLQRDREAVCRRRKRMS